MEKDCVCVRACVCEGGWMCGGREGRGTVRWKKGKKGKHTVSASVTKLTAAE